MYCRWCNNTLSKPILSFKDFPMYPSSVYKGELRDNSNNFFKYDFEITSCKKCNLIQQLNTPNLSVLYAFSRNEGVGTKWKNHYSEYAKFINNLKKEGSFLEIGGGNLELANNLHNSGINDISIVEIDKTYTNPNFKFYFNNFEDIYFDRQFDVIYSSHVFEHIENFQKHLDQILSTLKQNGLLFISLPNFEHWIKNFYLNAFVQDHLVYPTKEIIIDYLSKYFELFASHSFEDHSMFFCFKKKTKINKHHLIKQKSAFNNISLNLLNKFKSNLENLNEFLEEKITLYDKLFLFGTHIFSEIILSLPSMKNKKLDGILDNSKSKQNKYLYSFEIIVSSPEILRNLKDQNITLIIFAGAYENEILEQLFNLNPQINIVSSSDFKNYLKKNNLS